MARGARAADPLVTRSLPTAPLPAIVIIVVAALVGMASIFVANIVEEVQATARARDGAGAALASPYAAIIIVTTALYAASIAAALRGYRAAPFVITLLGVWPLISLPGALTPLGILDGLLGALAVVGVWTRPAREFALARRVARLAERDRRDRHPTAVRRPFTARPRAIPPSRPDRPL